ncbi:GNAT family N-acetyltransferase [Nocardioides sp. YIM 152315]|uniref:GNAT family N-acetyltransferase n=1 Tax=Nocardioides sp. YIM 152315 TaxID=3031760 RepID=UPI0023D97F11|nr:GNAT family N-acetyltransferase [Nocardioides sp. YIM 152315]MDF1604410.1 GNAT family N-acetyltransferase [Nocardioides sp. YIM 152315]
MNAVRIRAAGSADRAAVAALLRGLSAESSYRRFQTGIGPEPGAAVLTALLPDRLRGGAVLAYAGRLVVGHGVWVRAGAAPVAEIGLVVADAHQGRGIGTAMARALMGDLAARGVERVEVFASATNEAVVRMVTRQAPDAVRELDGATVTYSFPAPSSVSRRTVRPVA